jgi:uncharacterized protein
MSDLFTDNSLKSRFEYHVNGKTAFADYRREEGTLYIDYVESPPELRGTGTAGKLMEHIMEVAQKEKLDVVPICGYAAAWMSKHAP